MKRVMGILIAAVMIGGCKPITPLLQGTLPPSQEGSAHETEKIVKEPIKGSAHETEKIVKEPIKKDLENLPIGTRLRVQTVTWPEDVKGLLAQQPADTLHLQLDYGLSVAIPRFAITKVWRSRGYTSRARESGYTGLILSWLILSMLTAAANAADDDTQYAFTASEAALVAGIGVIEAVAGSAEKVEKWEPVPLRTRGQDVIDNFDGRLERR